MWCMHGYHGGVISRVLYGCFQYDHWPRVIGFWLLWEGMHNGTSDVSWAHKFGRDTIWEWQAWYYNMCMPSEHGHAGLVTTTTGMGREGLFSVTGVAVSWRLEPPVYLHPEPSHGLLVSLRGHLKLAILIFLDQIPSLLSLPFPRVSAISQNHSS